ncbi:MAG: outer membrane beta-barrel protein [Desulfobulbales bacterium]
MKKNVFGLIGCFFLLLPAVCLGATGWYGSVNAGIAMPADGDITSPGDGSVEAEYEAGYSIGGAVGSMMDNYRIEGEISYQANDVDSLEGIDIGLLGLSMDTSILAFLFNGYWDFNNDSAFTPYITGGIGFANVSGEITDGADSYDGDDTVFAYQLGFGAGFAVSETVTLDCRYRYLGTADAEITSAGEKLEIEVASHNITAGIRWAF